MNKLDITKARITTTMFPSDSTIEDEYENLVCEKVKEMSTHLENIDTKLGLENFIKSDKDSIDDIATLLGMSTEKLKRIVSYIRLKKGFTFESEWTTPQLRNEMIANHDLMEEFCELFSNGYKSPLFVNDIPKFILSDFKIDKDVLARLQNIDYLKRLVKAKVNTKYNKLCSDSYQKRIEDKINAIVTDNGLDYSLVAQIPNTNIKNIEAIHLGEKYVVINKSFMLTTSSSQTKYYEDIINPMWEEIGRKENIMMVNILDGAGWIGRPSDYKGIFYACSYFLNLKTIDELNQILKEFFNI